MKHHYPNESVAYRRERDALAEEEAELIRRVKAVAAKRRQLPPGGVLKEDYTFTWATDDRLGQPVRFSELFGERDSLLLYNLMFGPSWDNPCPSCTSIVDGFNGVALQVGHDAALVVIAKASAAKLNAWARVRGWSQIELVSGLDASYQADYGCQESDEKQFGKMNVFKREGDAIFHFWGSEIRSNDIDMVWPYWNLMDLTPGGRPDREDPPQNFQTDAFEKLFGN